MRALCIDDHPVNRDVLEGILRNWNMRTGIAEGGPSAFTAQAAAPNITAKAPFMSEAPRP